MAQACRSPGGLHVPGTVLGSWDASANEPRALVGSAFQGKWRRGQPPPL